MKINFIKTFPTENVYSEKEWNDMENHYMHELDKVCEQKDRALQHIVNLTESIKKKNEEIEHLEYFITSLTLSLKLSSDYVVKLRSQLQKLE